MRQGRVIARRPLLLGALAVLAAVPAHARRRLLHRDDFRHGLGRWLLEAEVPGRVSAAGGVLDIDTPRGTTLWFRHPLTAPVSIELAVTPVAAAGGANDAVSDVNFFWMAHDPASPDGNPLGRRGGAFAEYDTLRTYYVGLGGNRNTSSRFRRYVGRAGERPLLPRHDLSAPGDLLTPNREMRLRLVADGARAALFRDGREMFALDDPDPYRRGWFAIRTTQSHLRVRDFRIWRL